MPKFANADASLSTLRLNGHATEAGLLFLRVGVVDLALFLSPRMSYFPKRRCIVRMIVPVEPPPTGMNLIRLTTTTGMTWLVAGKSRAYLNLELTRKRIDNIGRFLPSSSEISSVAQIFNYA